jgi:predicted transcriptional regulator
MRIAWRLGDCAARDVYSLAGDRHGMSVSTVKTHLRRLVEKGYLSTTQVGNSFLYHPIQPLLGSLKHAADRLLENALEGTAGPLLAYMVKKTPMSSDELAELRALLERAAADGKVGEGQQED